MHCMVRGQSPSDYVVMVQADDEALEGLSEALSQEVAAFGIKVTMIEPGAFATDFASSSVFTAHRQDAYDTLHASLNEMGASAQMPGP